MLGTANPATPVTGSTAARRRPTGRSRRARTVPMIVVAGALGVFAAGCGSSSTTSAPTTAASSAGASGGGASAPAGAGAGSSTPATSTVTATETEFHIALSRANLTAGRWTFAVDNAGSEVHALSITGPGLASTSTGEIQPGANGSVTVTLAAGTYDVYCPVSDHKARGMDVEVTVR